SPLALEWALDVLDREELRDLRGEELRAVLEEAVSRASGDDRGALINLRRDVFNSRRPRPATLTRARPGLDAAARERLRSWLDALDALASARERGSRALAEDTVRAREHARAALSDDELRGAVLLQSQVLERNMDRYLDPGRKFDKSARHLERTLLELLYRASLKTSPFSTLTSVGIGRFRPDAPSALPNPDDLRKRSTVRLNVAVLARLAAVILADPRLRSDFSVTLAPDADTDGDRMRYVRRRTTAGADPDAVVAIDTVHEDLFFLPSGPVLNKVAGLVRDGSPTLRELSARVADAHGESDTADTDRLLGHLLRLGFLIVPDLQMDLRSDDPGEAFTAALEAQEHAALRRAARALRHVRDRVTAYSRTPARERARVLASVRASVEECFAAVGADDDLVPRTLVYEDTTFRGADADRDAAERALLPDLAALADLLPAFDLNLPRRLTAREFFVARYGSGGHCDDVVRFCHEFQRDFFDPYLQRSTRRRAFDEDNNHVPQENWFRSEQIEGLDRARHDIAAYVGERLASAPPGTEEIRLGPELAERVLPHLPPATVTAQPWSFLLQVDAGADGAPGRTVLNQAYAGMTLMFSRFAHSLADQGAPDLLRDTLRGYAPDGAVLAELHGGYETTNLNIHPVVTDYEIVCPGDHSDRPAEEQILLDDLFLVHDEAADRVRLVSRRLEREVVPVYLGYLMPLALPEVQQVLLCFSPSGMAQMDLWAGTGQPVPQQGVTPYPRLVLGDLVLQRRMWKMSVADFPERDPGRDDAEYFLRVRRWQRDLGLPERIFAQIDNAATRSGAVESEEPVQEGGGTKRAAGRKPLPVDFGSWHSVQLLEQMVLAASSRLVLTEALPDTDGLWLRDEHGRPHVSEMLIELYDTGRDRHVR
ncbi:lantibiotic dehydratase, partial [Nocardiopsis halotolerans]|uniref:lantibiotic dehydratase n=1 Tax=Nocardiopsis halotolerans TaxID=124252 RepID=UPI00037402EB